MSKKNDLSRLPVPPSEQSLGDLAHSGAKVIFGLTPFVGGAFSEVFEMAVAAPAGRRMRQWLELVGEAVNDLIDEANGRTAESLGQNEAFVTAAIATTRSAMITTQREKLSILQGVIKTAGSGQVLDEFLRSTFLAAVDRYTAEHVTLLKRCADMHYLDARFEWHRAHNPDEIKVRNDSPSSITIEIFAPTLLPEVPREVATEIFADLHRDRFCLGSDGFAYTFSGGQAQSVATVRGKEFLRFIFGAGQAD